MPNNKGLLPYVAATIMAIIFGLTYLFSKIALSVATPFELLSFRFLIAFVIMTLLIIFRIVKVDFKNKPMKLIIFLGLCNPILGNIFDAYGLTQCSSSQAGIIIALVPIAVTILAIYLLKEIPSGKQAVSIVISILGVVFIVMMGKSDAGTSSLLGITLILMECVVIAVYNVLSRKLSLDFSPFELTYFSITFGAVFFNAISVISHIRNDTLSAYFDPLFNKDFLIPILYLGIFASIFAFFLLNYTLSKIEASKTSVFSNVSTIVAIIAGVLILKENFQYYHIIGSVFILAGVWGTNYFDSMKIAAEDIKKTGSE
ncbi:MAG: DMT family transporter [Clostridiaceae bacterium]